MDDYREPCGESGCICYGVGPEHDDCPGCTRSCGHDDYHDPHECADRPGVWCPGIGYDDEETAR